MGCRPTLPFVLLGIVYAMLSCPSTCAQLPKRLQRCLPYPTLADEIREMQQETPRPKVRIDAVTFPGAIHLPESIWAQIAASLEHASFDSDSDWIGEVQQVVTNAWQEHGYFYAEVSAQAHLLSGDPTHQRFSVTVHVDEGRQYWLGDIQFGYATVFPSQELRNVFPLRDGGVFNIRKIREGFEALRTLYGSQGYIDLVASPVTQVDNAHQRISLLVEVQEGKQFRVGSVEVLDLDQTMESLLKSKLRPGDPFNPRLVEDFYNENKSVLPAGVSPKEDMRLKLDFRNGTVAIVFDFGSCPQPED